ncbi:ParB N-terminal domain-containing protein [Xanthobacter sp. V13C-7B]|uniref:ParB/RepB/Spo0J family partition protein n=1 Tax=Xanthobacter variabilis TaxID=3119932 RepID=UPI0037266EA0
MATITIALDKLDADPCNVRKSYSAEGVASLAASIRANEYRLLQNLVVRPAKKRGHYFVTAGGRRRAALMALASQGEIPADHPVECKVCDGANAAEISLTENLMREDMHPVDAFEAFNTLAQAGTSVADIAARFGTTETMVRRRLALARVAPTLLAAYRADEMTFELLTAFTVSCDHAEQERVWASLTSWNRHPSTVRRALMGEAPSGTDRRVEFIGGLEAYEAAGGSVTRDLFDGKAGGYATDIALLERLVGEKLDAAAEKVRREGWKWVECVIDTGNDLHRMPRVYPKTADLSPEQQAQLDDLTEQFSELNDLMDAGEESPQDRARFTQIDEQIEALQAAQRIFSPQDIARAGAFVSVGYSGEVSIQRGFVRPEDNCEPKTDDDGQTDTAAAPGVVHSATLLEDLTAQKTAILRTELAGNADIALAAIVHVLLLRLLFPRERHFSCLQLALTAEPLQGSMRQPDACAALAAMEALEQTVQARVPANPAELWDWCLDQTRDELLVLLAFAAGNAVDAVAKPHFDSDRKRGLAHADMVALALAVPMAERFTPTADSYWRHLPKASIEAGVAEACGPDTANKVRTMKKGEAAAFAEQATRGSGWLPVPMRIAPPVALIHP